MERPTALLFALSCFIATPLMAQTTSTTSIGGGTCNSSSLNGTYALTLTGRQVTSAGAFTNVFQANGTATFDGLSGVAISLNADTAEAFARPLPWSGTYSVQSNCEGQVTITTGGSATFNMVLHSVGTSGGTAFLLTGNDATYTYSGSGNAQPSSCSVGMLSGVYTLNATGFTLNGNAVNGAADAAGLLQFDGQGNVTINLTPVLIGPPSNTIAATGTYSISNCVGLFTLSDSKNSYNMSISISAGNNTADTTAFVTFSRAGNFMLSGTAHAAYGQPTSSPTTPALDGPPGPDTAFTGGRP
jgi:hypothetical protein